MADLALGEGQALRSGANTLRTLRSTGPAGMKRRSLLTSRASKPTGRRIRWDRSIARRISAATVSGPEPSWVLAMIVSETCRDVPA